MNTYTKENILICNVKFHSVQDESIFFEWINKIDCIDYASVKDDGIYLYIAADDIHEYSLRDLLGLFYRYDIEMTQLARYLTPEHKSWFYDNKKTYWHKKVFKNKVTE